MVILVHRHRTSLDESLRLVASVLCLPRFRDELVVVALAWGMAASEGTSCRARPVLTIRPVTIASCVKVHACFGTRVDVRESAGATLLFGISISFIERAGARSSAVVPPPGVPASCASSFAFTEVVRVEPRSTVRHLRVL